MLVPKPMPTPPSSDITGVDRDRHPLNNPDNVDPAAQQEALERQDNSPGRPVTGVGEKLGRASSRYTKD